MMRLRWLLFLTGLLLIGVVCSQNSIRRLCNAQATCGDCILANPACIWCADTEYNGTRCYPRGDTTHGVCLAAMIQDPQGEIGTLQEVTLTGFNQVSPSRVEVHVRPGQSETFPLSVHPARNFPIDVYLLMDLSFSMRDDLASLKFLGADLATNIVRLSNNFTIGFGSFVDKVAGPFVTLDKKLQQNPCFNINVSCEPTYSYRHTIALTSDADRFNQLVQNQRISGNQDSPEGGFDGFLQSLLCTELIGWRSLSRKLLLYITDAGFHLAGDGKLGGIILPHPNRCLFTPPFSLTAEVEYEHSLTYDYPSVGQIAQALRTQDIIPIFAAVNSVRGLYDALAAELGEGAFVGTLASDSSNVVELVETLYNTISQRVIFDQEPIPGVSVVATPTSCPGGFIEDGICTGLEIEQTATYDISVSVSECTPELLNGQTTLDYRLVGFGTVRIDLTALCQCECEDTLVENAAFCSNNGNLTCGLCICNSGFFGEQCQCNSTNQGSAIDCPTGDNNLQCSDRGTCQCGICNCPEGFFGLACECDESQCVNQDSGLLCSGRGTCGCDGNCTCTIEPVSQLPYFGGDVNSCECTPNTQNCRDPTNQTSICNGHGTCGCDGSCECEDPYFGQFCDLCSGSDVCLFLNCDSNQECSNCALDLIVTLTDNATEFFRTAEENALLPPGSTVSQNLDTIEVTLPGDFCSLCDNGVVIISGADTAEYDIEGEPAVRCEVMRDGCIYRYFVAVDTNTNNFSPVHVEYEGTCQARGGIAPWIIVLSIVIPLLALGLLLLVLLKALLLLLDNVEVRKFEKDIKNTQYSKNENPLYRSAAKDYKNPIYGK